MKSIFSILKQSLIILGACVLLLVSTGCGSRTLQSSASSPLTKSPTSPISDRVAPKAAASRSGTAGTYNDRVDQQTELYGQTQKPQGGMNNFSDVDPRAKIKSTERKATNLMQKAQSNGNRVNNPEEFADTYRKGAPISDRTENILDRVTDSAQNTASDVAKGAQRGLENLKGNIDTAKEGFSEGSQAATSARQSLPEQITQGTQGGVNKAAQELNRNKN